ncbi:hypothetical protein [Actinomadura flavalba]|uniref:hypothetical protein n=1 Tax=Actinomadura flavalba TaxID=1120938 RepID=UPI000477BBD8|nr:hypothetical protein [Actinomadura flavalba]
MTAPVLACTAQVVFVIAFVLFKSAADQMRPLAARRPLETIARVAGNGRWVFGLLILVAGFVMADLALLTLPIASALPAYAGSLIVLLVLGYVRFGERLTPREWFAMIVVVAAMATSALSVVLAPGPLLGGVERPDVPPVPPLWAVAVVLVPSLVLPWWMFSLRDRVAAGRHARALTGIAHGIGAGALLGTAETFGLGMALLLEDGHTELWATPYPWVFLLAGVLGIGLLSIGLQRCRLTVLVTVLTVTAKAHLLISSTLLLGEPWPDDLAVTLLRGGSVVLAALAVLAFPRHQRRRAAAAEREPAAEPEPPTPGRRRVVSFSPPQVDPKPTDQPSRDSGPYVGRRRRDGTRVVS